MGNIGRFGNEEQGSGNVGEAHQQNVRPWEYWQGLRMRTLPMGTLSTRMWRIKENLVNVGELLGWTKLSQPILNECGGCDAM
jgi:hypothetical protein